MRNILAAIALTTIVSTGYGAFVSTAQAETAIASSIGGDFVQKQKSIKGSWEIQQRGEQTVIVFGDDFKAKRGPDLKVFLSPNSVDDLTGKTATDGAVLISALSSNKGGQEYVVPEGIELSDYESILVHCEAYSVLWGGGDL